MRKKFLVEVIVELKEDFDTSNSDYVLQFDDRLTVNEQAVINWMADVVYDGSKHYREMPWFVDVVKA